MAEKCEYKITQYQECMEPATHRMTEGHAMWLCAKHVKSMRKYGLNIERIR